MKFYQHIHRVTLTSFWLQQQPPPRRRYSLLQQCRTLAYACKLFRVELYTVCQNRRLMHFAHYLLTLSIPPTWRNGFVPSPMTSLHLIYSALIRHSSKRYGGHCGLVKWIYDSSFRAIYVWIRPEWQVKKNLQSVSVRLWGPLVILVYYGLFV